MLHHSGITYPVPVNITYWWNFGVLALLCLAIQLITGIFLAMHFVANADLAFLSFEHIMRDIQYGWLLRYVHSNGAAMFFFSCIYSFISRALLWFIQRTAKYFMVYWRYYFINNDFNRIYGLCFTMRSNEFLSGNCYYKFSVCYTLYW